MFCACYNTGNNWNIDLHTNAGWTYDDSQWPGSMAGTSSADPVLGGVATCWPPSLQMEISSGTAVGHEASVAPQSAEGIQTADCHYVSLDQRLNLMIAEENSKRVDSCMAGACSPLSGRASDSESSASLSSSSTSSDDEVSEYSDSLSDNELDIIQLKKTPSALLRPSADASISNKYSVSPKIEKVKNVPVYRPTRLNRLSVEPLRGKTIETDNSDDSKDEEDDDDSEDSNLSEDLIDQIVRMNPLKSGLNSSHNAGSLLLNTLLDSIPSLRSKPVPEIVQAKLSPVSKKSAMLLPQSKNCGEASSDASSDVVPVAIMPVVPETVPCTVGLPQILNTDVLPTVSDAAVVDYSIVKREKIATANEPLEIDVPSKVPAVTIKREIMSPEASLPSSPVNFESIISRVISGSSGARNLRNESEGPQNAPLLSPLSYTFGTSSVCIPKTEARELITTSDIDQQLSSSNDATEKSDSDDYDWLTQIIQSSIRYALKLIYSLGYIKGCAVADPGFSGGGMYYAFPSLSPSSLHPPPCFPPCRLPPLNSTLTVELTFQLKLQIGV